MRDESESPVLSSAALHLLREDQPNARELQRAYARFRAPRRGAPGLLVSRWLVAGLVMGLGIAFGAEAVVETLHPAPPARPAVPGEASKATRKAAAVHAAQPSSVQNFAPPVAPLAATSELKPPRGPSSPSAKTAAVSADEAPADSAVWAKAAEGLRKDDFAETRDALATLEHAGSSSDREAARLIRAQLMLHEGDKNGARALLQDLSSNAQAAQVRAKAVRLLAETAKSNSALNVVPSGT